MLAGEARSDAESGKPCATIGDVHQDIGRLDVLVDEASLMQPAECRRDCDRKAQKLCDVQRAANQSVERLTAGILEHERHAIIVFRQRDWSCRPASVELVFERTFMFEPFDGTGGVTSR